MERYYGEDHELESPYTGHPELCEKCQHTTCFSLHNYSTKACPFRTCDECTELETLDSQISQVHDLLITLSTKRRDLKARINDRHDRLVERIPVEVVSIIFLFVTDSEGPRYAKSNFLRPWTPSLVLGAVCRKWRAITLDTPRLWTKVTIDPWKHALLAEVTAEWLSRSCALPISLTIKGREESTISSQASFPRGLKNLIQLLRDTAGRWKDLHLDVTYSIAFALLDGLEGTVRLNNLQLDVPFDPPSDPFSLEPEERKSITMKTGIVPKSLLAEHTDLNTIPLRWGSLTHLQVGVGIDTMLHIFRHATNLQKCIVDRVMENQHRYPLPTTPVLSNLKTLHTCGWNPTIDVLRHLNLPSLKNLKYSISMLSNRDVLLNLADFLERSKPSLETFMFFYSVHNVNDSNVWYHMFPTITDLWFEIDLPDVQLFRVEEYIRGLNAHLKPLAFPNLRFLSFTMMHTTPECWSLLGSIFPDRGADAAPEVIRPLEELEMNVTSWDGQSPLMSKRSYQRLWEIRRLEAYIGVFDGNGHEVEDLHRFAV